jgi:HK97 family phage prohead protease
VNRRAAAMRRSENTRAITDRPRQRRCGERAGTPAVARGVLHGVEIREEPADATGPAGLNFRGYASVTETPYDMWDMFGPYTETIAASAFDQTLADNADVAFLLNHGGMTLARTASGTLRLAADDTGLLTDADLDPQNSVVRDLMSGVRRGDLSEMSFAFTIKAGSWSPDYTAYRIEQVDMSRGDVSVVNYGANPNTFIGGSAAPAEEESADDGTVDVDALDDEQALALAGRLEQRHARRAAAARGAHLTMTRAELDALAELAAPHPLARVQK